MTSTDTNVLSTPADQYRPSRSCNECAADMKHLSDLPSFLGRAAVRIFRCYACNNVVAETR
jgi:hypothetical protein